MLQNIGVVSVTRCNLQIRVFKKKGRWENTDFTIIQLTENSDGTGWQNTFLLQFDNMHQSYHRLHTHSWYISIAEGKVRRLLYGSRLKPDIHQTLAMGQSLADLLTRLTGRVSCWPQVHPSVDPQVQPAPEFNVSPSLLQPPVGSQTGDYQDKEVKDIVLLF